MHITWSPHKDQTYPVVLRFETLDRPGVLADITTILGTAGVNIADVRVKRTPNLTAQIDMEVQVHSAQELRAITQKLASLEDVLAVSRPMEEKSKDASRRATS